MKDYLSGDLSLKSIERFFMTIVGFIVIAVVIVSLCILVASYVPDNDNTDITVISSSASSATPAPAPSPTFTPTSPATRIAAYQTALPERAIWTTAQHGLVVAVGRLEYRDQIGLHRPPKNGRFVYLQIVVENNRDKAFLVDPRDVTLIDQSGSTYNYSEVTYTAIANRLETVSVLPGYHTYGHLVFLLHVDDIPAKIVYALPEGDAIVVDLLQNPTGYERP